MPKQNYERLLKKEMVLHRLHQQHNSLHGDSRHWRKNQKANVLNEIKKNQESTALGVKEMLPLINLFLRSLWAHPGKPR